MATVLYMATVLNFRLSCRQFPTPRFQRFGVVRIEVRWFRSGVSSRQVGASAEPTLVPFTKGSAVRVQGDNKR
jgi:hypothetical protein